jgi:putative CocE/NonD family hydrolase
MLRRTCFKLAYLAFLAPLASGLLFLAADRPAVRFQFNVPVRMRDGVTLAAHVFLPKEEGKFPVILIRTPYGKEGEQGGALYFAERGYAVVTQDTRGRNDSDGEWYAFKNEADDGYDSIEWAASQSWSNGKVVTMGGSYLAIDQWLAATRGSSHLAAMVVLVSPSDLYRNTIYPGGAFQHGTAVSWAVGTGRHRMMIEEMKLISWPGVFLHLPVESGPTAAGFEPKFYRDWINHPSRDDYWKSMSWQEVYPRLNIPVLHIGGWFDIFQEGTIENFVEMTRRAPEPARRAQKLLVGPWAHGAFGPKVGEVDFGPSSVVDVRAKSLRWLDHYVRGKPNGAEEEPPVEIFTMGVKEWRSEAAWPPADTAPTKFFLHSKGRANTAGGDGALSAAAPGDEPPDHYDYDPANPVPTTGGGTCCNPVLIPWGAMDQRRIENRKDLLVYTTSPLEQDLEVTGPVEVHVFASSNAPDTDWTAKLVDVAPDGFAMNLTDGILRARFRRSLERPELLTPGEVYEFVVQAGNTSNVFRKGHRIRLEISSSNFPRFSRNTNTGRQPEKDASFAVARQTVYHDGARPSHVILPVRRGANYSAVAK